MVKKKLMCISLIVTACLCGCSEGEISQQNTKSSEILTESAKSSEIASERIWETTEARSEVVAKCANPPEEVQEKIAELNNRKSQEEEPEQIEGSTGEVDINGYGWVQLQYSAPYNIMENHLTRSNGSIRVFGHRETWYSTNESAGQATAVEIPDKHVADDGTIRDKDGYICVASSDLPFYSIVMTSVGPAKVYDCGCSHGTIDVYTNW